MKFDFVEELEQLQVERKNSLFPFLAYDPQDYQADFHRSTCPERWLIGANQIGKTIAGAADVIGFGMGIHPVTHEPLPDYKPNRVIRACGDTFQHGIEEIIVPELCGMLHASQYDYAPLKHKMDVRGPRGKFRIQFRTYDQELKAHAGQRLDMVWFDEEPPRDVYAENRKRLIRQHGRIIGTMTPDSGITWTYQDVFMDAKNKGSSKEVFGAEMIENDYLRLEQIKMLMKDLAPEELAAGAQGMYASLTGLVYPEFNRNVHIIEPFAVPKHWAICVGIDHGLNNPTTANWLAISPDDGVYVVREYVSTSRTAYDNACVIREITEREFGLNPFLFYAIDPSTDRLEATSLTSVWNEYRRAGIFCRTQRVAVEDGVNWVRQFFKIRTLTNGQRVSQIYFFREGEKFRGVPLTIQELQQYQWAQVRGRRDIDMSEKPRRFRNHFCDGLRYALQERPTHSAADSGGYAESYYEGSDSWTKY